MEALGILIGLSLVALPFVLPIALWVSIRRLRARLDETSRLLQRQTEYLDVLLKRVTALEGAAKGEAETKAPVTAPTAPATTPLVSAEVRVPEATAPEVPLTARPIQPRVVAPESPPPIPAPIYREEPVLSDEAFTGIEGRSAEAPPSPRPAPPAPESQPEFAPVPQPSAIEAPTSEAPPPPAPPTPPEPPPPWLRLPEFDWERLVGVRLFSAIAGIALVLAGIFFLRYSIEHGWLQPTVRVAIGVLTGVGLLVVCELKAARKYPVTANALDAAAIAILFSTFFSAYALWQLVPAGAAFALLAVVTTTAVLLSIRRESLFIAVLGLLGGFATPALLSTGENRPIGLFSYLMLLNVGLAWVAYRQRWPILTALTLAFTAIYQWGWIARFLDAGQLPLATGIFVAFAAVSFAALVIAGKNAGDDDRAPLFEKTALLASAMPLLFAVYFATVPEFGDRFWLLFGFLLLVDAGLFAIALARSESLLHAAGAIVTVVVFAAWLGRSYTSAAWPAVVGIVSVFVMFYLTAPLIAARFRRAVGEPGERAVFAAPVLLFVFAALVRVEPATDSPALIFIPLFALVTAIGWRAIVSRQGTLYYTAAFLTLTTEAVWTLRFLRSERLGAAVVLYTAFALMYVGIPMLARRQGRPLQPEAGSGVVLLASLGLLLFLAAGPLAPQALWAFALLLAILNAALFIESAAARLPLISVIGTVASWVLLGVWWARAGGAAGVLPGLLVIVGFTLLMLGGYAWTRRTVGAQAFQTQSDFRNGVYIALVGHLFLMGLAADARWSVPPWPLFGALAVVTIALLTTALAFSQAALHAATVGASAIVLLAFAAAAEAAPWPTVSIAAFAALAGTALAWIPLSRLFGFAPVGTATAAAAFAVGELGAIIAAAQTGAPNVWILTAWHTTAFGVIVTLTARERWPYVAVAAAVLGGITVAAWAEPHVAPENWAPLLILATPICAVFIAYPLLLGARSRDAREPYLAAIVASAWFLLAARHALIIGGYESIVGIVPVALGAIMALLLRQLLRLEPVGARDLGRLAMVAAAALGFITVAIPLQLQHQWITIGWALEGAALAWLFRRIPHRGLLLGSAALLGVAFVRLALNPEVFRYVDRGSTMRIFNWYLYAYLMTAAAMFSAAWWLSETDDALGARRVRMSYLAAGGGVVLLFLLLNIEIADYYSSGPEIMFRFGSAIAQDLTYTIGWLLFGLALLAAGIVLGSRAARGAAVGLIAVTALKCFLYDLGSLEGLYRVAAFVGLAISLTLVSLVLQKFVLMPRGETA
jgi:uncharacterized membrane protein